MDIETCDVCLETTRQFYEQVRPAPGYTYSKDDSWVILNGVVMCPHCVKAAIRLLSMGIGCNDVKQIWDTKTSIARCCSSEKWER